MKLPSHQPQAEYIKRCRLLEIASSQRVLSQFSHFLNGFHVNAIKYWRHCIGNTEVKRLTGCGEGFTELMLITIFCLAWAPYRAFCGESYTVILKREMPISPLVLGRLQKIGRVVSVQAAASLFCAGHSNSQQQSEMSILFGPFLPPLTMYEHQKQLDLKDKFPILRSESYM